MSENRIKTRRTENYKNYIKNILSNRDIDCDESWWDSEHAVQTLNRLVQAKTWEIADSCQMNIHSNDSSELFLFLKYTTADDCKDLIYELTDRACALAGTSDSKSKNIYIICIVDNMKDRVFLEKSFLSTEGIIMKKTIRKELNDRKGTVNFLYILDNNYGEQDIKLNNLDRFDFIQMPPVKSHINWENEEKSAKSNRGYVTSVQLYQLVEIYNKIGDKLFRRNVRYGLNEQLGVDRAIKETLRTAPGEFWFKNNGITILVERTDFKLDRVGEVLLEHIPAYGDLQFSVINGAQTITASAQYFYEMEYELEKLRQTAVHESEDLSNTVKEDIQKLENALSESKKAKVLLRIIHIMHESRDNLSETESTASKKVNEISVALNRQKPIKAEDIAFASPFIEKLVSFLERDYLNEAQYFRLVKRGEGNTSGHSIDLVNFARARKACAGYPGEARSNGTNILLKFDNNSGNEYTFKDTDIFVSEWLEAEEELESEIFRKYYSPISFAVKVADLYTKQVKKIQTSDPNLASDTLTILQNGKWYFTAYLVQLFNGFQNDFSDFTDRFDFIRDKFPDLMKHFAEQCSSLAHNSGEYQPLDSNTFKNNNLYHLICEKADVTSFSAIINRELDANNQIELLAPIDVSAPTPVARPRNHKVKFVQFDAQPNQPVDSTAHAMTSTVQFVLDNYPGHKNHLLRYCKEWLTNDSERVSEGYSYLRRTMEVTDHNGETFWVGTHSNSSVKYSQIEELCRISGVKQDTIYWLLIKKSCCLNGRLAILIDYLTISRGRLPDLYSGRHTLPSGFVQSFSRKGLHLHPPKTHAPLIDKNSRLLSFLTRVESPVPDIVHNNFRNADNAPA